MLFKLQTCISSNAPNRGLNRIDAGSSLLMLKVRLIYPNILDTSYKRTLIYIWTRKK